MVRPRRERRISFQPDVTYFKPAGVPMSELKETVLSFSELEALRLLNIEEIEQNNAAKKMNISQSTLSRLVQSARKKLTNALIEGHAIKIEGGNFKMESQKGWGKGRQIGFAAGPGGFCLCPKCNHKEKHDRGVACYKKKCPKCGSLMTRK